MGTPDLLPGNTHGLRPSEASVGRAPSHLGGRFAGPGFGATAEGTNPAWAVVGPRPYSRVRGPRFRGGDSGWGPSQPPFGLSDVCKRGTGAASLPILECLRLEGPWRRPTYPLFLAGAWGESQLLRGKVRLVSPPTVRLSESSNRWAEYRRLDLAR